MKSDQELSCQLLYGKNIVPNWNKSRCNPVNLWEIESSEGSLVRNQLWKDILSNQRSRQTNTTLTVFALSDRYKLSPWLSLWDLQSGLICTFRMQHKGQLIKDKTMNALWCCGLGTGLGDPPLQVYLGLVNVTLLGEGEFKMYRGGMKVWLCMM